MEQVDLTKPVSEMKESDRIGALMHVTRELETLDLSRYNALLSYKTELRASLGMPVDAKPKAQRAPTVDKGEVLKFINESAPHGGAKDLTTKDIIARFGNGARTALKKLEADKAIDFAKGKNPKDPTVYRQLAPAMAAKGDGGPSGAKQKGKQ